MGSNHDNIKQRRICNLQSFQWSKMADWTRKTISRTQLVYGSLLEVRSARVRKFALAPSLSEKNRSSVLLWGGLHR